jgi:hypothetical protein
MTRRTNARVAGITFLVYTAAGISSMVLSSQATAGASLAEKMASVAGHAQQLRLTILLGLVQTVCALVLAVTLYSITRDVDEDLALLGLLFRVGEGLVGAVTIRTTLQKLWLGTAGISSRATADALGAYLLQAPNGFTDAILFVMGSTLFSWLLLRGRIVPVPLAWLGVAASVLLLVALPLQLAGFASKAQVGLLWIPMLAYELPLGLWLIVKGAKAAMQRQNLAGV